ncbi:hypothetical protein [Candidatus Nucleicultrix amoebiphila]|jgi:hypothetical protein|uniref:hypothetical protein n=1 Tax=Candidatus Nucleicultrix amoebiphila TaxID=1509244 RepID=UPI0012F51C47|nr:hypothetical protein [Candidatus Nucleicultrix amoebiphila]
MSLTVKILWGVLVSCGLTVALIFSLGGIPAPTKDVKRTFTFDQLQPNKGPAVIN